MSPTRKTKKPVRKARSRKPARKPAAKKKARKPAAKKKPKAVRAKKAAAAAKPKAAARARPAAKARPKPEAAAGAAQAARARRAPTVKSARPRARSRKKGAAAGAPLFGPASPPGAAHAKLGVKYECFECGAKFYDLNRPEPLCPRCGTDQRLRPKADSKAKLPAPPRPRSDSGMQPLLEEEEVETASADQDALDLGLVEASDDSFLGDEEDSDEDESEAT